MATATSIGPEKWKEASIGTIKVAQTLIARTEGDLYDAKVHDPLPLIRDGCIQESNKRIHRYARASRAVVIRLRQAIVATNEEIKAMNRVRNALEKSLDHARKDLTLNVRCTYIRQSRPTREKSPTDGADVSLNYEYVQLEMQKKQLELQLGVVLKHLQTLSVVRAKLNSIVQERSRATDLLCHSISSTYHCHHKENLQSTRHIKAFSAPPTGFHNSQHQNGFLDVLTPTAIAVLNSSDQSIQLSQEIQRESHAMIKELQKQQQVVHDSVNECLTQKVAQTVTLAQHLQINSGETSLTLNKTTRHLKQQETSLGYTMGPISSRDLFVKERLDRPLVKVYQTHPGTDLPEGTHLIDAGNLYSDSISVTQRNIALLKLARKKLSGDLRDKKIAMELDSNIVRLRRKKADHRWVLQGNGLTLQKLSSIPNK